MTNSLSVVVGDFPGNAGYTFPGPSYLFIKGRLCCEEAFLYVGWLDAAKECGGGDNQYGCGTMGDKWETEEQTGWSGVWVRRGKSGVFDVSYTGPGGEKETTTN